MNENERTPADARTDASAPPASTTETNSAPQAPPAPAAETNSAADAAHEAPEGETVVAAAAPTTPSPAADSPLPERMETTAAPDQAPAASQDATSAVPAPEATVPVTADKETPPDADTGSAAPSRPQADRPAANATPASRSRTATPSPPADETGDRLDPRMRKPAVYKPRMDPGQTRFRPRQPMSDISLEDIHYKNVEVLIRFIDGQGRILPRRKTRISAKMQRRVKTAIKQARHLALLPYTPSHIRSARRR